MSDLLVLSEAAAHLNVSESTVRRMTKAGELKVVRFRRTVRWRVQDLDTWVERHASRSRA